VVYCYIPKKHLILSEENDFTIFCIYFQVKNTVLSSKALSAPRAIVLQNENRSINQCYIVGDGLEIKAGKDIKEMMQLLLMFYYEFDLNYPKCYQLLGFLQFSLFQDSAPFFKCSNYLKFVEYIQKKDSCNWVHINDCKGVER